MERSKVYPEYLRKLPNYEDQEVERIHAGCRVLEETGLVAAINAVARDLVQQGEQEVPYFVVPIVDPEMRNNPRVEARYPDTVWKLVGEADEPIAYRLMFHRNVLPHIEGGAVVDVTKYGDVISGKQGGADTLLISHRYLVKNERGIVLFSQEEKALSLPESLQNPALVTEVVQDLYQTLPAREKVRQ